MAIKDKEKLRRYRQDWYKKNKAKRLAAQNKRRLATVAWINTIKSSPCTDCGKSFPTCCMQFDHIGDNKLYDIASMTSCATAKILEEIEKCELVCANCHAIRTNNRFKGVWQSGLLH